METLRDVERHAARHAKSDACPTTEFSALDCERARMAGLD
jgi:hypothetical protein